MSMKGRDLRASVFNSFPCDQEPNYETRMMSAGVKRTGPSWSLTECQSPPPQSSKVCVGVFEGEGSSDKRDFFGIMRKCIVVVIDGSERGSGGVPR